MKRLHVAKTQIQKPLLMCLVVGVGTACGRSGMLLEPGEATPGAGGATALAADAGLSSSQGTGGAQLLAGSSGSFGGAGVGGTSFVGSAGSSGASSGVSTGGSKPTGGNSSSLSGGRDGSSAATSLGGSKPVGGSSPVGGSGGGRGGTVAGGSKASGGTTATGGTTTAVTCVETKACGGDVVGTWKVRSSCLNVSGQTDLSLLGLGCQRASAEGSLQVTGDWIARADHSYTDKTTTQGRVLYSLPASCLRVSGTTVSCSTITTVLASLGESKIACVDAAGGGCTCTATVSQVGSAGVMALSPSTSGTYKTSGNTLVLDGETRHGYCTSGSQLTMSPQGTIVPTTGTIVFQKQ